MIYKKNLVIQFINRYKNLNKNQKTKIWNIKANTKLNNNILYKKEIQVKLEKFKLK